MYLGVSEQRSSVMHKCAEPHEATYSYFKTEPYEYLVESEPQSRLLRTLVTELLLSETTPYRLCIQKAKYEKFAQE